MQYDILLTKREISTDTALAVPKFTECFAGIVKQIGGLRGLKIQFFKVTGMFVMVS